MELGIGVCGPQLKTLLANTGNKEIRDNKHYFAKNSAKKIHLISLYIAFLY